MGLAERFGVCIPCDCSEQSRQSVALSAEYLECFPADSEWSIDLRSRTVLDVPFIRNDPVHLYLSLVDPNGEEVGQIHGFPFDRDTGEKSVAGWFGNTLRAVFNTHMDSQQTTLVEQLWSGSRDEFASKLTRAAETMEQLNDGNLQYHPYIPLLNEQNSNAMARKVMEVMDLRIPDSIRSSFFSFGRNITWAPGFARQDFEGVARANQRINKPIPWGSQLLSRLSNALSNLNIGSVTAGVLGDRNGTRMASRPDNTPGLIGA
ncbi:MAG: hypothetical protein AAF569_00690 [Pseudomonadota bacterium]